jgi:two-component system chemotaxis response regulator CheY
MRVILKDILDLHGYKVVAEASNKAEAIARFKEFQPDIVFMDIVMDADIPFGGIEATREILEYDPEAKIIIVSAVDQHDLLEGAFKLGVKNYINKPFDEEKVVSVLKESVEQK